MVVEGGQAGRIGGGLDPNAIQKGGIYWYRDTMDGVEKQVEVVAIDRSVQPPSFAIRVDGRERETEVHRLFLHQSSLPSLSRPETLPSRRQGSVHGAVPAALDADWGAFGDDFQGGGGVGGVGGGGDGGSSSSSSRGKARGVGGGENAGGGEDLTAGEGDKEKTKDRPASAPNPGCAGITPGIVITPIAKSPKPKTSGPDSYRDYNEQCQRSASGQTMCWDDDKQNNSQVGDFFGFYKGNVCVEIHRVDAVQDPSYRLPSWSNNVGQQGRNVLVLSSLLCVIPWQDWVTFGWHASGPLLGTQRVANDQARVQMIHYIHAHLQRTQRPGIFSLGSEEGGAGRDKGAGAGTGQKRAAPPSDRDFAAMPAEKRARDDHHGSGSVASDDADATAHRDLHAALDVQGAERCERCGRDFTQWEPQQRPAQVCLGSRSLLHHIRSLLLARKFSFDAVQYCR